MKIKHLFIATILIVFVSSVNAQQDNPYKSIGKKGKVLTLSKGKYDESFDTKDVERIGTVLYNIRTKRIVKLLNADSVYKKASNNSSASRWYSPDPLAAKYATLSPYAAMGNNPILFSDVDGRDIIPMTAFKSSSYYSVYQKLLSTNASYNRMLKDYKDNTNFNYYLGAGVQNQRSPSALASTSVIDGTVKKGNIGMITGLDTKTTTFSLNETKTMFEGTSNEGTYGLNDLGRAFVLLHEGAHAGVHAVVGEELQDQMHETIAGQNDAASWRSDIESGLKEFNTENKLGLSDKQVADLSYMGLQGTQEFDKHFGLDKITDTKEYANKQGQIIVDLLQLIYTEKKK